MENQYKKNQWFKFYGGEYLSDPKMLALSPCERSCWLSLLSFACVSSNNGKIKYLTEERLMIQANIDIKRDEWKETIGVLKKFESMEMITLDNEIITIKNWEKRQQNAMTGYERIKKHREKKRNDNAEITQTITVDKIRIDKIRKDNKEKNIKKEKNNTFIFLEDPEFLEKWEAFLEMRKSIKKNMTDYAKDLALKKLHKHHIEVAKVMLERSIEYNWQGLFDLKLEDSNAIISKFEKKEPQKVEITDMTDEERARASKKLIAMKQKFLNKF